MPWAVVVSGRNQQLVIVISAQCGGCADADILQVRVLAIGLHRVNRRHGMYGHDTIAML